MFLSGLNLTIAIYDGLTAISFPGDPDHGHTDASKAVRYLQGCKAMSLNGSNAGTLNRVDVRTN